MHCEPNCRDSSASSSGRAIAAVLTATLSAPARSSTSTSATDAHTAADRQRDEHLLGGAPDDVEHGGPARRGRRHVEERQLVGALRVVGGGQLDGIACVAQVLEVDALDHPAVVDVQARDDADREISGRSHRKSSGSPTDLTISSICSCTPGAADQRRARGGRPRFTGQVGDDAAGRPHQRHTGRVIPDMVAEADCAAEDSGRDVGQVDSGRAVHPHPRALPAQVLEDRHPIPAREARRASRC